MDNTDPKDTPRRQCRATAKSTGERCKRRPIIGGTVCRMHGGAAPQVQRSARQRLLAAVEPAIGVLVDIVEGEVTVVHDMDGKPHRVGSSDTDRIKAAIEILNRTGYPARTEVDLGDSRDRILAQLRALSEEGAA